MTEGRRDGHDSRAEETAPGGQPAAAGGHPSPAPDGDAQTWYRRGLDLLGNGSPAAAAQLLERAAGAEPQSRMVREAGDPARGVAQPPERRQHESGWSRRCCPPAGRKGVHI